MHEPHGKHAAALQEKAIASYRTNMVAALVPSHIVGEYRIQDLI